MIILICICINIYIYIYECGCWLLKSCCAFKSCFNSTTQRIISKQHLTRTGMGQWSFHRPLLCWSLGSLKRPEIAGLGKTHTKHSRLVSKQKGFAESCLNNFFEPNLSLTLVQKADRWTSLLRHPLRGSRVWFISSTIPSLLRPMNCLRWEAFREKIPMLQDLVNLKPILPC